jgi:serine/threonine protein phosphatase PrpC
MRDQVRAAGTDDPAALALALVAFANASGGHDNITAAVARVGLGHNDQTPTPGGEPSDG